jgi:hypothetical protein
VNEQSYQFAASGRAEFPLVAPEGGKEPLIAQMADFTMGSDHQVYMDSSWRIPAIYMNDWPDRYIHTNKDTAAMIDPTKLKRSAFIGAASGYFLARLACPSELSCVDERPLMRILDHGRLRRVAEVLKWYWHVPENERINIGRRYLDVEYAALMSVNVFLPEFVGEPEKDLKEEWGSNIQALISEEPDSPINRPIVEPTGDALLLFQRIVRAKGPMSVFGYDYFEDKFGEEKAAKLKLLSFRGLRGSGGDYAYEVLNFVDGQRNAQQIRDAVSAEYGPVPLEYVVEYLRALESIGVVQLVKP